MSAISGIGSYQNTAMISTNQEKRETSAASQSGGSTQGADTVSISSAALAMLAASNTQTGGVENKAGSGLEQEEPDAPLVTGICQLEIGDKVVDIKQAMQDLAASDFKAFRKLLDKMNSTGASAPSDLLSALSELTGAPQADLQLAIQDMNEDELNAFAAELASLTNGSFGSMAAKLTKIQNMELISGKELEEELQEIAAQDFMEFLEMNEKIKSDNPAVVLSALSELSGLSEADFQRGIELMDSDKLREVASYLGRATGASPSVLLDSLMQLPGVELRAWTTAEANTAPERESRLNVM